MITIMGSAALWLAVGFSLRRGLERLSERGPNGTTRSQELLIRRYHELGDEFVAFLVYWGGSALFSLACGLALGLRGHLGPVAFCMAGATLAGLLIAAALRYGKGTFPNVARLVVFWRN